MCISDTIYLSSLDKSITYTIFNHVDNIEFKMTTEVDSNVIINVFMDLYENGSNSRVAFYYFDSRPMPFISCNYTGYITPVFTDIDQTTVNFQHSCSDPSSKIPAHMTSIYTEQESINLANSFFQLAISSWEYALIDQTEGTIYLKDLSMSVNTGHTVTSRVKQKASFTTDGTIEKYCIVCNKSLSNSKIKRIKSVNLSYSSATYNGKTKNPKVIVKDSSGKTISSKYYTVSKPNSIKNVGKYKINVSFKGNYTGRKSLYFTVNPPTTKITKLIPGKKSIKVKFTKKTSQTSGYQIAYSKSKSFKGSKYKTVSSYKSTSTTIKTLSAKTVYHVKIRTYKVVSGKKYYSNWSSVKAMCTSHTHSYAKATCTKAKTCKICGATSGKPLGHTNSSVKCSRCGKVTFKNLTFSGTGIKKITNINIPNGDFVMSLVGTGTHSEVIDNCYSRLYDDKGYLKAHPSVTVAVFRDWSSSDKDTFEGPVKNGVIKVEAPDDIKWTITIEPY